ncbi:MAG: glutamate 5-kinase [Candidatus Omnitrophica bacterium]|nr:glutamate 5-kinase [Candidatus Omnitrophota bacterium]
MRKEIVKAKRIVVKVGSSILTSSRGHFSAAKVKQFTKQVAKLVGEGKEAVVVSSGAIACGMGVLRLSRRPKELPRLQACAAIGQGKLMKAYEESFSRLGHHAAQILLTKDGLFGRERYLNTRNTLFSLLAMKVVPVINENDSIATDEIRFGDNDTLSALVAGLIEADLLIILSDVDGVYRRDGSRISAVRTAKEIQDILKGHLFKRSSEKTVGGMETKLEAGNMMIQAGIPLVIADGGNPNVLAKVINGEDVGTLFYPLTKKRAARKNWLAFSLALGGSLEVDEGARRALTEAGRSLLASGIKKVEGAFEAGDAVSLKTAGGGIFANGLSNYSSGDIQKIKGKKTDEIAAILGHKSSDEVVHRDNLVILSKA